MKSRVRGKVSAVVAERAGIQELLVETGEEVRRAVNYPALTGPVRPGQEVTLNSWAVELKLGTGGLDFVLEADGPREEEPPGHILKLRYTPMQIPVLAAEAPESPHHEALAQFTSLEAAPVICAEVHSQVAPVAAAVKQESHGRLRVAYVMTDGAALPLAFSTAVPELRERGLLDATITAGQAFGGDFEAVNLHSALAVAKVAAGADVIVVAQGPGGAGTDTPLGFSGIDQGIALNAAASLGGVPIAALRLSLADPRPRHQGISHHTRTVLGQVALCRCVVPCPELAGDAGWVWRQLFEGSDLAARHDYETLRADETLDAIISQGVPLSTMGRSVDEERPFFLAATAAGILGARLAMAGEERE